MVKPVYKQQSFLTATKHLLVLKMRLDTCFKLNILLSFLTKQNVLGKPERNKLFLPLDLCIYNYFVCFVRPNSSGGNPALNSVIQVIVNKTPMLPENAVYLHRFSVSREIQSKPCPFAQ